MSGASTRLALLLRQVQWACDEAAFEVGGGRYSDERRRELATRLDEAAAALRASTGDAAPTVVEADR